MSEAPATLSALQAWLRRELAQAGIAEAAADARVLVCGLLGLSPAELLGHGEKPVTEAQRRRLEEALARRVAHEPVHRILGRREFYGLDLRLSPETLEPRPDTEILVDTMLPHVRRIAAKKGSVRILDLGTGTGAIVLALLKECPEALGVGADISAGALATARENAVHAGVESRFIARKSDWFGAITGRFDIIVSNPPYIRSDVIGSLAPEVRDYDPPAALDGGEDGLEAYRRIAASAGEHLETDGLAGLEIGFDQKDSVSGLFLSHGFVMAEAARDYGGNDRVLVFRKADDS